MGSSSPLSAQFKPKTVWRKVPDDQLRLVCRAEKGPSLKHSSEGKCAQQAEVGFSTLLPTGEIRSKTDFPFAFPFATPWWLAQPVGPGLAKAQDSGGKGTWLAETQGDTDMAGRQVMLA